MTNLGTILGAATYILRKSKPSTVDPLKYLDIILSQLTTTRVTVMPGENDPTSIMLPQREMDHCLFDRCLAGYCEFVTNPFEFSIGPLRFIGTSGQNIKDIQNQTKSDPDYGSIHIIEQTFRWGHICPTAPDTLPCLPINSHEPFTITKAPNVYFAGNQLKVQYKIVDNTLLLCVPEFSKTGQLVLVCLNDLSVVPITLGRPSSHGCKDKAKICGERKCGLWTFEDK
ncbi:hypothetical protein ACOME3_002805 [Neoechinorhynchus agilis]